MRIIQMTEKEVEEKKVWLRAYCASLSGVRACEQVHDVEYELIRLGCAIDANEAVVAFEEKFYGEKQA